ncbi:MAG: PIG-L deacetylase family protein [Chloroflexota bacterium]
MSNILVFSPHFDDESIGCGGAIARHVAEGGYAAVVFMTRGDTGNTTPGHEITPEENEKIRKREADAALKILGVQARDYLDLPDGFMQWSPETVKKAAAMIRKHRPDVIYAPHADDAHNDHKATWKIVSDAIPRAAWSAFPDLGEPWYCPEIRGYEVWQPISAPNFYINITDYIETKSQAILQYSSQLADQIYNEAALGLNRYRGAMGAGVKYAEAFIRQKVETI